MYEFHTNKETYFTWQRENTEQYVIPFIEEKFKLHPNAHVLEIGCGEGGVLRAFVEQGCVGTGVELDASRIDWALKFNEQLVIDGRMNFYSKDIYDTVFQDKFKGQFDLIVLKDVIEHIHNQPKLMEQLKNFLKPGGKIFYGFPPWQMPFGGHQQMSKNKLLARLPYYHLLPMPLYKGMRRLFGESKEIMEGFVEIKETGISIERFERICRQLDYKIYNKTFFLINPIYSYKFGLKPRKQNTTLAAIPYFRNYVTTCVYYLTGL